jgi:hypothetical protein
LRFADLAKFCRQLLRPRARLDEAGGRSEV